MIKKVIIAEDYQSVNISLEKTLEGMGIVNTDYVTYCDDAFHRINKALQQKDSYDLLITDLYFEQDHREQAINNGEDLIARARMLQPDLKIVVFSATGKSATIEMLFEKYSIDGYVCKGRNDAMELQDAIKQVEKNKQYYPRQYQKQIKQKNAHNFTGRDLAIITQLANGVRQKDIPAYLKANNIDSASLSSVEKRLNLIKSAYDFSTNEQLIAFCKDNGIL